MLESSIQAIADHKARFPHLYKVPETPPAAVEAYRNVRFDLSRKEIISTTHYRGTTTTLTVHRPMRNFGINMDLTRL